MRKIYEWVRDNIMPLLFSIILIGFAINGLMQPPKVNPVLKDYKDGVQNHLTWDIKGQCFFVRPNDDVTVYLIRVQDCDKK